jgi:L-alanine-DL-glutamate epimerase-like enolase superfamily enzyme
MKINKIEVWNFSPTFRDGPYVMSHVTQHAAYGRIVRVSTGNYSGVGEIVFAPSLPAEQRQSLISQEPDFLGRLIGKDILALDDLAHQLRRKGKAGCGVAFGLETALLDLIGHRQNQSLTELLGGALSDAVDDYFSISERSTQEIQSRVKAAGVNRKVIQLKLGIGDLEDDFTQITATLDAMNERQLLLADANGGWSVDKACDIINRFDDRRLVWEEPCTSYAENAELAQKVTQPIMLDQCVGDINQVKTAITDGFADSVCIKPAFLGGLKPAREIRDLCIRNQVKMRIDGPWCGDIATAANLHLAVGAPPELLVAGCDLREPLLIEPCLYGVTVVDKARIAPPTGPGLGIDISDDNFDNPDLVLGKA